ncbi:hypothetical protein R6Q59_016718 [Mikania micrantha]
MADLFALIVCLKHYELKDMRKLSSNDEDTSEDDDDDDENEKTKEMSFKEREVHIMESSDVIQLGKKEMPSKEHFDQEQRMECSDENQRTTKEMSDEEFFEKYKNMGCVCGRRVLTGPFEFGSYAAGTKPDRIPYHFNRDIASSLIANYDTMANPRYLMASYTPIKGQLNVLDYDEETQLSLAEMVEVMIMIHSRNSASIWKYGGYMISFYCKVSFAFVVMVS